MCANPGGPMIRTMFAMLTLAAAGMLVPVLMLWVSDERRRSRP
jgi:hypothetical protein